MSQQQEASKSQGSLDASNVDARASINSLLHSSVASEDRTSIANEDDVEATELNVTSFLARHSVNIPRGDTTQNAEAEEPAKPHQSNLDPTPTPLDGNDNDALEAFKTFNMTSNSSRPQSTPGTSRRERLHGVLEGVRSVQRPFSGHSHNRGRPRSPNFSSRSRLIPSYMLPIGRTRISSPDRTDPAISTREVDEMFKDTNLLADVPQDQENRRLLEVLRSKAETARSLVMEANEMWKQRLNVSLDVSIGALKREHERERREMQAEFDRFKPNANLEKLTTGDELLVPKIKNKQMGPTMEHRDYASKHVKVQQEHNITRFLVKRSALLIRQQEQLDKIKHSLGGSHQRLERIRATQFEAIDLAISRVETKVKHCDRLSGAVASLIDTKPKIRLKRSVLETLETIRHSMRLIADLAANIPQLYESVCVGEGGPIEISIPTTDFRPTSANFYPRSVLSGRSREDLVRELSSFLPYSDKGHLHSRSPSREQSRERDTGPHGRSRSGSPANLPQLDPRPNSAPAGIFVGQSQSQSQGRGRSKMARAKSAGGQQKQQSALAQGSPITWAGQLDDGDQDYFDGHAFKAEEAQHPVEFSPLDSYRQAMRAAASRPKSSRSEHPAPATTNNKNNSSSSSSSSSSLAKKKASPLMQMHGHGETWSSYLESDRSQCPHCLSVFEGEGFCLPSISGPDAKITKKFRESQQALHQKMLNSTETKRTVKRLLADHQKMRRAQGRSPNDSQPFKFCSWECLKHHTVQHSNKAYKLHYQTIIDLAAGYIVGLEPPK